MKFCYSCRRSEDRCVINIMSKAAVLMLEAKEKEIDKLKEKISFLENKLIEYVSVCEE